MTPVLFLKAKSAVSTSRARIFDDLCLTDIIMNIKVCAAAERQIGGPRCLTCTLPCVLLPAVIEGSGGLSIISIVCGSTGVECYVEVREKAGEH